MNPQAGPLVRVVGGVSLVLLCVQVGLRLNAPEWEESPPATFDDLAATVADASPEAPRPAAQPSATPSRAVPAVYGAFPAAGCGASCGLHIAAPAEFPWGTGPVATALVTAPPVDELPPARGADVAVAFAQAAAWSAPADAVPQERPWPAPPVLPTRPGGTWLEPVVSALFDPDPAQPLQPATPAVQPTEAQSDPTTPRAVPLDTAGMEPAAPLASAGAPFKRDGQLPADKASGRAPVPLAAPPVTYGPRGISDGGGGPVPTREDSPSSLGPDDAGNGPGNAPPDNAPDGGPGLPTVFPGPDDFPGRVPNPLPDRAPEWVAPRQPTTLPLLHDPKVPERVATGEPQPGDDPLLTPRFEPVALPADAVGATAVSEPGALALLAIAAMALAASRRTRHG